MSVVSFGPPLETPPWIDKDVDPDVKMVDFAVLQADDSKRYTDEKFKRTFYETFNGRDVDGVFDVEFTPVHNQTDGGNTEGGFIEVYIRFNKHALDVRAMNKLFANFGRTWQAHFGMFRHPDDSDETLLDRLLRTPDFEMYDVGALQPGATGALNWSAATLLRHNIRGVESVGVRAVRDAEVDTLSFQFWGDAPMSEVDARRIASVVIYRYFNNRTGIWKRGDVSKIEVERQLTFINA
jgi:hypothetical protein